MPFSFKPEISQQAGAQTSSVPQPSFGGAVRRPEDNGTSILQVALYVAFGGACVITAALFGYKMYLSSHIEKKKADIAQYEQNLAGFPLEDMRNLSNRIKIINQLVKEHPSVNVAFRVLEDSVENQITYTNFNLRYDQGKNYLLQLDGVAPNYRSVVQQVDTYKQKPYTTYVTDVSVDGLTLDAVGRVNFTLKLPIAISGILPEEVSLSDGAAARVASSTNATSSIPASTSTPPVPPAPGSGSPAQ